MVGVVILPEIPSVRPGEKRSPTGAVCKFKQNQIYRSSEWIPGLVYMQAQDCQKEEDEYVFAVTDDVQGGRKITVYSGGIPLK